MNHLRWLICILPIAALACLSAGAHPHFRPIRATTMAESALGTSYGGYGFIARSEAEAQEALRFGCSNDEQRSYLRAYDPHCVTQSHAETHSLISDTMRALILDRIRDHFFEYLTLQAAAGSSDRAHPPFPVPACLQGIHELGGLFQSLPATQPSDIQILATRPPLRPVLERFRAVSSQLSSGNMVRALIFYDQMHTLHQEYCADNLLREVSYCNDIGNQLARIQASFPVLFQSATTSADRDALRARVEELLGSRYPRATTSQQRQDRGQTLYNAAIRNDDGNALSDLEHQIANNAQDARAQDRSTARAINSALSSSLSSMNLAIRATREHYLAGLAQQAANLCTQTLSDFLRQNPNIVRQTILDLSNQERGLMQAVLCDAGIPREVNPRPNCAGVVAVDGPQGRSASVQREAYSFPYSTTVNYFVRQSPRTAPPEIEMTINVDTPLSEARANAALSNLQNQVNTFYNCQSGAIPRQHLPPLPNIAHCPTDPAMAQTPVHFNIRFHRLLPGEPHGVPLVHLYHCYNEELPENRQTNCRAIREHHIRECEADIALRRRVHNNFASTRDGLNVDEYLENISLPPSPQTANVENSADTPNFMQMTPVRAHAYCENKQPPEGDEFLNRQDSGTYTEGQAPEVALHEVGHLLNLDDEYEDPTYPFLPLGEHDSIMGVGSVENARIYPRHLRQMIAPLNCPSITRGL